jgi:hypothetical protein
MAAKLRIYIDTSVVSAYFDARELIRQEQTQEFWQHVPSYDPAISRIVLEEIQDTPNATRRSEMLQLVQPLTVLAWTSEMDALTDAYLAAGVFGPARFDDAQHVAAAVVSRIPVLLSWNFGHMVSRNRRLRVNLVNSEQGYGQIDIIAPPELL